MQRSFKAPKGSKYYEDFMREQSKEIARLVIEGRAKDIKEALEIVKAYCSCDQTESNKHRKEFNNIIEPYQDFDKDVIYDKRTGETIKYIDD